jgi:hypothetical protein
MRAQLIPVPPLVDGAYWNRAHGDRSWLLIEVIDSVPYPRWEGSASYRPLLVVGDVMGPLVRPRSA